MTTIAYRDGVLAGDSRITASNTIVSDRTRKVWRFKDGRLFGLAGGSEEGEMLRRVVEKHQDPITCDDVSAVLIMPNGDIYEYEGRTFIRLKAPYTAIGSGADLALVAMDFGASAEQAVKGAARRNVNTGGRITCVKL